jgi:glucokinase
MILAGDVGGTKTNLGLFEVVAGVPRLLRTEKYRSPEHPGLAAMIATFLAAEPGSQIEAACFGVPGPVLENRASTPNLAWQIDGDQVAREAGLPRVLLINDLVATAEGIPLLQEEETAVLQRGEAAGREENRALIAAGTGLGMALLPRLGGSWIPVPSEGGHADFAPRNEEEIGLLRHLRERFGRVSIERVLSGPGLFNVYSYLRDVRQGPENPRVREALGRGEDPARVIGEAGLAAEAGDPACGLCARALEIFAAVYGAVAGNLALTGTATGGVWLGGGIAPKILPRLADGLFIQTFVAKGRFVPYLERVPVRVILNDRTAMLGAARRAFSQVSPFPGRAA